MVYVDDLCTAAEKPEELISIFKNKYKLEVKGDGKLAYPIGADYFPDPDGAIKELISIFKNKYKLEVKGDGKLAYPIGADYFPDPDGAMVNQPKKYVEKLKETYIRLFNEEPPKGLKTPLDKK